MIQTRRITAEEGMQLLEGAAAQPDLEPQRSEQSGAPRTALREAVIAFLKQVLVRETKLPADRVTARTPFEQFGIDSVMVLVLTRELESCFGELPKTLFFEYQSIHAMAGYFLDHHGEQVQAKFGGAAPGAAQPQPDERTGSDGGPARARHRSGRTARPSRGAVQVGTAPGPSAAAPAVGAAPIDGQDIAIIGVSGRFPQAPTLGQFWENLREGRDCIREIPPERWDYREYYDPDKESQGKSYSKWGGFLDEVDRFDPLFFNISPREAAMMDPQERLFLETVWHTLEDAGYTKAMLSDLPVGVFAGVMWGQYQLFAGPVQGNTMAPGSSFAAVANRVSYFLNLHGPSMAVDTMCSSSLTAIHLACDSLRKGESKLAIAGGVNLSLHPNKYLQLSQGRFTASDGRCRAFGEGGDGYVPGEGVAAVLLKPLREALADGDRIYAVIKATAINHGGKTSGYTVPNPNAQGQVISEALQRAGIDPRTITYVETHGTGTALGDPIEVAGLVKAFGAHTQARSHCALGSVKSNIGHLESAAGMAGLVKVLLQMQHRMLVPSLHSDPPNPHIRMAGTPFYVQRELTRWEPATAEVDGRQVELPLRAAISSFGAGGSNAHLIVEAFHSPMETAPGVAPEGAELVVLSARTGEALDTLAGQLAAYLLELQRQGMAPSLSDVAYTLQVGREPMECRLALVADNVNDLIAALEGKQPAHTLLVRGISKGYAEADDAVPHLRQLLRERNLRQLAEHWVAGAAFDWGQLVRTQPVRKVSLPQYPFARERCWAAALADTGCGAAPAGKPLHALLDANESDLEEQRFTKLFRPDAFYLRDHTVQQRRTLPGVVCLEMARAAGDLSVRTGRVHKLRQVMWPQPLTVDQGPKQALVSLFAGADLVEFELATEEAGSRTVHAAGSLVYGEAEDFGQDVSMDLESIRQRCQRRLDGERFYQQVQAQGLSYGQGMQSVRELWLGAGEALASLDLPRGQDQAAEGFVLPPALLDGMFQTVAGLVGTEGTLHLPVALEELAMLRPVAAPCFVHAVTSPGGRTPGLLKFDLQLVDQAGRVMVAIREFAVRPATRPADRPAQAPDARVLYASPVWEPAPLAAAGSGGQGPILVLCAEAAPVFRLRRQVGRDQVIWLQDGETFARLAANTYVANPSNPEDYRQVMGQLQQRGQLPGRIIMLGTPTGGGTAAVDLPGLMKQGVLKAFALCQALLGHRVKGPQQGIYLYQATDTVQRAADAAMAGFFKSLRQENPQVSWKAVEWSEAAPLSGDQALQLALDEFSAWQENEVEVAYRAGLRFVRVLNEVVGGALEESLPIRPRGVYLITGGMGGLGLLFAEYLAREYQARLVLTGRSEQTPEHTANIRRLEAYGAEVLYLPADVAAADQVRRLVGQAGQRFGQINGVIHSAGVLRDAFLLTKKREDFEAVLAPKIAGLLHLDAATSEGRDFLVTFSSVAALAGNPGQTDYAYANRFMDAYAELRASEAGNGRLLSLNWPLWLEGGMTVPPLIIEQMKQAFGLEPLTTEAGLRAFRQAFVMPGAQVAVLPGAAVPLRQAFGVSRVEVPAAVDPLPEALVEQTESYLKELLAHELQLPAHRIDPKDPLERYGIDSVMIMALTRKLEGQFGKLSKTLFFEYRSIHELAGYFLEQHREAVGAKVGWKPAAAAAMQDDATAPAAVSVPSAATVRGPRFRQTAPALGRPSGDDDVAIIGVSGRYPMARTLDEFWDNLRNGRDCITEIPPERWDYRPYFHPEKGKPGFTYSKWGGFIDDVDKFDARLFQIAPAEAELLDPQERLFLETAWETFEDAGYTRERLSPATVGVYVGVMYGQYQLLGAEESLKGNPIALSSSYASVANRVSHFFHLRGPSIALDTMCSSSLTAIHLACESLKRGETDMALAGGVNVSIHPSKYLLLSTQHFPSTDGRCRSFGEGGDGYVPGEGVGAVLLKPLRRAQADGDRIYGVIRATSVNHGGKTHGYTVPNPHAQADLISAALQKAGIDPQSVSFIEAHGTGTALGDPIEIAGLARAFGAQTAARQFCAIGSAKSNIGHLESAAGIAGVTKVLLQMKHRQLAPSLHAERLNPHIAFDETPFYVQRELQTWAPALLRAGVSSFGAGGSNAHVLLEEYVQAPLPAAPHAGPQLVLLSALNGERLRKLAERLYAFLQKGDAPALADVAYTLQTGRQHLEERAALIAASMPELLELLGQYVQGNLRGPNVVTGNVREGQERWLNMLGGRAGAEFRRAMLRERDLARVAEAWVCGLSFDWDELHQGAGPRRVSLPTYPFARDRHWVPQVSGSSLAATQAAAFPRLHPMLERNISTASGLRFATHVSALEAYVIDLDVRAGRMLAGAALLEMVRCAGELAGEARVVSVADVAWGKPAPLTAEEVHVRLFPHGEHMSFEVSAGTVLCQGALRLEGHSPCITGQPPVLGELLERLAVRPGGAAWHEVLRQAGEAERTLLQAVREWREGSGELLVRLELPANLAADGLVLPPAFLHSVVQAVALYGAAGAPARDLPYTLEEISILHPLPAVCYAYIAPSTGSPGEPGYQILFLDESGRLLAQMKQYRSKRAAQVR
jgi:acyl transferase domain-containing protein/acyl carrier protein